MYIRGIMEGIEMRDQMVHRDPRAAFEDAIRVGRLSTDPDAVNFAGKYMYMHTTGGVDHFKNSLTRRYDV